VPLLDTFTLPKLKALELELSNNVVAAVTVSVAELLVTLPEPLVTVTGRQGHQGRVISRASAVLTARIARNLGGGGFSP
jgi:hypothetical protein